MSSPSPASRAAHTQWGTAPPPVVPATAGSARPPTPHTHITCAPPGAPGLPRGRLGPGQRRGTLGSPLPPEETESQSWGLGHGRLGDQDSAHHPSRQPLCLGDQLECRRKHSEPPRRGKPHPRPHLLLQLQADQALLHLLLAAQPPPQPLHLLPEQPVGLPHLPVRDRDRVARAGGRGAQGQAETPAGPGCPAPAAAPSPQAGVLLPQLLQLPLHLGQPHQLRLHVLHDHGVLLLQQQLLLQILTGARDGRQRVTDARPRQVLGDLRGPGPSSGEPVLPAPAAPLCRACVPSGVAPSARHSARSCYLAVPCCLQGRGPGPRPARGCSAKAPEHTGRPDFPSPGQGLLPLLCTHTQQLSLLPGQNSLSPTPPSPLRTPRGQLASLSVTSQCRIGV